MFFAKSFEIFIATKNEIVAEIIIAMKINMRFCYKIDLSIVNMDPR